MGPTGHHRVVQIHPTRRCNLECLHCYSSSSPRAGGSLPAETLFAALDGLAGQGYTWASFSGGEPLVYPRLPEVLGHARQVGLRTGVVTNGILLSSRRLDAIAPVTDLLVISLDGRPETHDRMRNSPHAFDRMARHVGELHRRDIAFGFLFTLTQHNLDELPWVVEFAANVGASALQVHPLDAFGHAATRLPGKTPDATEGAFAWRLVEHVRARLGDRLAVQLDLLHTDLLTQHPGRFFLDDPAASAGLPLSARLSPLVIEPDGWVVPLQFGFPRHYALGNLHRQSLDDVLATWEENVARDLHALATRVAEDLRGQPPQLVDWYARMAEAARRPQRMPSGRLGPVDRHGRLSTAIPGLVQPA
jgi:MoaA/NifB/PqqE/SkfB family radical SAM enzyme